jgi:DNA topoisomerase I
MSSSPKNKINHSWQDIEEGDFLDLRGINLVQKFTQPPSRYSAASLIKKLEELGIGRPSTYASIITTLGDRGYVDTEKSSMKPTILGMQVNNLLVDNFEEVTNSTLTAQMEDNLDEIAIGKNDYVTVLSTFWSSFAKNVEEKSGTITEIRDKYREMASDIPCPKCNSTMQMRIGRFGEYLQCEADKTHQFAKNFKEYEAALEIAKEKYTTQTNGLKCSECKTQMIVRVSKASLKPYIACPEYRVGNKHSITNIEFSPDDPNFKKSNSKRPTRALAKKKSPSSKSKKTK